MQNVTFFAELQHVVDFSQLNQAHPEQFERLFAWVLEKKYDLYDLFVVVQMMQQPQEIFAQYIQHLTQRVQQLDHQKPCHALKEIHANLHQFKRHIGRWQDKQQYASQALILGKQLYQYHCKVSALAQQQARQKPAKNRPAVLGIFGLLKAKRKLAAA